MWYLLNFNTRCSELYEILQIIIIIKQPTFNTYCALFIIKLSKKTYFKTLINIISLLCPLIEPNHEKKLRQTVPTYT